MADQKVTVNIPKFTGEANDFQMWWTRLMSHATVCKFASCLKTSKEADLPDSQTDYETMPTSTAAETTAQKKAENAAKRNDLAMATFAMAFATEALMNLVHKAQSSDWPQGLAHNVVASSFKKHRPTDLITRVELRQQLNATSMKKDDDPSTLFEQVATIENLCAALARQTGGTAGKLNEEDIVEVIIDKAPAEHQSVLTTAMIEKGTNLARDDLEVVMEKHCRTMACIEANKSATGQEKEVLLAATDGK